MRLVQISRGQNRHVDSLATLASSLTDEVPPQIKVEVVKEPNIDPKVNVLVVASFEPSWMDLIIEFQAKNRLPSEGKEVDKVHKITARF